MMAQSDACHLLESSDWIRRSLKGCKERPPERVIIEGERYGAEGIERRGL